MASAAALGYLSVHNMDKVTLNFMKGDVSDNPFGTIIGKTAYFRAVSAMEEIEFDNDVDIEKCITSCPDTSTGNGLTVIVSDFMTDSNWKKAVDYLCYKKRQVLLLQIMTPDELEPAYDGRFTLIDSESIDVSDTRNMKLRITRAMQMAYEEALRDFKKDLKDFCTKRGVDFVSIRTDIPIERVLFAELLNAGIME